MWTPEILSKGKPSRKPVEIPYDLESKNYREVTLLHYTAMSLHHLHRDGFHTSVMWVSLEPEGSDSLCRDSHSVFRHFQLAPWGVLMHMVYGPLWGAWVHRTDGIPAPYQGNRSWSLLVFHSTWWSFTESLTVPWTTQFLIFTPWCLLSLHLTLFLLLSDKLSSKASWSLAVSSLPSTCWLLSLDSHWR
jgi:hypothetical protein